LNVVTYRIGVLSDTHGFFHPGLPDAFVGVDLILHGGDVGGDEILDRLESIAPVQAVSGNVDGSPTDRRPLRREIETPLGRIAITHGHLRDAPSTDRVRLVQALAEFRPRVVIYGHSHIPKLEWIEDAHVFNPGAAGRARFAQKPTIGLITGDADDGGKGPLVLEHRPLS
jgi:hypothetical protein